MDLAALTGILGGATAVLTSVGTIYATGRAKRKATRDNDAVSWAGLASTLQEERNLLRKELDTIDNEYKAKIRDLHTDYTAQLAAARIRISQLETEVEDLYRRLGRAAP